MSKITNWIDETPNRVIYVSFALSLLFLILVGLSPMDSTIGSIFAVLFLLSFIGILFAVAKALDNKNRSFWWFGLFILVPLIGLIVILALDDHSEKYDLQQI